MDVIALCVTVAVILFFVLIFRKKSRRNVNNILEGNKNVSPLFLEKSATIKYNTIRSTFNADHPVSLQALQLNRDFSARKITIEQYHDQLDKLIKKNVKE